MYKKELEDSWAYQNILRDGIEQGIHHTLISYLEVRYPMLVELAQEQTSQIKDADRLRKAATKVFGLQTAGEVEEFLLSLGDDATKN